MWAIAFWHPRGSHAHTRIRADARGGDGSVREELAAGVNAPLHEKKKPRASHLFALENPADVDTGTAISIRLTWSVADQAANLSVLA
jgi:hypothetical protein